ncbi:sensor histidine kinase [Streptomyces genisteinicus]|uniref:sensor histidine kinase n=1 Tax=Streptomyces genisteinicus TaxID=2768068 RepID=UPI001CA66B56|nr:nitrate- and nitrite sensing domain-containing protein [Streptomyces genisteinicus]
MHTPRTPQDGESPPAQARPGRGRRAHAGAPAVEHTGHRPSPAPEDQGPPDRRTRRLVLRARTVRAKVICLLMVPVLSLLALWGFATVTTAQDMAALRLLRQVETQVGAPVAAAVTALETERLAALRQIAAPDAERAAALRSAAERTDAALRALGPDRGRTVAAAGAVPGELADRLTAFAEAAGALDGTRRAAAGGTASWERAYDTYGTAVEAAFAVTAATAALRDGGRSASDARVLLELDRAGEMLARQDALLGSARLSGGFTAARLRLFTGAAATRTAFLDAAAADLRGPARAAWRELAGGAGYRDLRAAEDRIGAAPAGRQAAGVVSAAEWDRSRAAVAGALRDIGSTARRAADRAEPAGNGLLTAAGAAVALGLVAVVASLVISVRIGRGLVVELVTLRNGALDIARRKLPHAMARLRTGEQIDIHAEAPAGPPAEDEIGQVGEALGTVHRAALGAAVERAELAGGISGVFVNLARRSQTLVHRQLALLDAMERRADDPAELGDLFRLDHLTTRMRRHAESLIILSGAAPGRAWSTPVPLTSVVRAAVSEIEDYARIEVRTLPEASVNGTAVADVTHLLAELVENAAQFSPPHTKVRITGEPVGNGYALEVEDRGLGMGRAALAEANRKLEESEALDLFDSDRLGLFVVSRLASRHGIRVRLGTSPYGGSTAVVLLPTTLLQPAPLPGGDRAATATGRPSPGAPIAGPSPAGLPATASGTPAAPSGAHPALTAAHGSTPADAHPAPGTPADALPSSRTPGHADPSSGTPAGAHPASRTPAGERPPTRTPGSPQRPTGVPGAPGAPGALFGPGRAGAAAGAAEDSGHPAGTPSADPGHHPPFPGRPGPRPVTGLPRHPDAPPPGDGTRAVPPRRPAAPVFQAPHAAPPAAPSVRVLRPGGVPAAPVAEGELPRRVRQTHLVPQLRGTPRAESQPGGPSGADDRGRTPELVRDRMAAYRDGWVRGGGTPPGPPSAEDRAAHPHSARSVPRPAHADPRPAPPDPRLFQGGPGAPGRGHSEPFPGRGPAPEPGPAPGRAVPRSEGDRT